MVLALLLLGLFGTLGMLLPREDLCPGASRCWLSRTDGREVPVEMGVNELYAADIEIRFDPNDSD